MRGSDADIVRVNALGFNVGRMIRERIDDDDDDDDAEVDAVGVVCLRFSARLESALLSLSRRGIVDGVGCRSR